MILHGDCRELLPTLPAASVRCCVTSPPYWGLRDYGVDGQIGLEKTPEAYVAEIVAVFREVRRVLADDGTLWLNLGDSYARQGGKTEGVPRHWDGRESDPGGMHSKRSIASEFGAKPKDLVGIPWRVAFALQADGWYLRSDIIWHKPNPMPESVTDRPTKAHEYVFLLSKSASYFFDAKGIREPGTRYEWKSQKFKCGDLTRHHGSTVGAEVGDPDAGRNARTVWTIPTQPTPDAHFATFPEALAERCILAGTAMGDTVLDPFFGSGTVGRVAERLGRKWVGIELNHGYVGIAEKKTAQRGLF